MKHEKLEELVNYYSDLFKKVCYGSSIKYSKWNLEENMYMYKFVYTDDEIIDWDLSNKLFFLEQELMKSVDKIDGASLFVNSNNISYPRSTTISISIK